MPTVDLQQVFLFAAAAVLVLWAAKWIPTISTHFHLWVESFWMVPSIAVPTSKAEVEDVLDAVKYDPSITSDPGLVPCWDPATMDFLGNVPAMTREDVKRAISKAKAAQSEWSKSKFSKRRTFLRILLKYILENQETICRVSSRDSGKPMVDAAFGEVIVTCEKISWLLAEGERWLAAEERSSGYMMLTKKFYVEYHPVGVVGAIVPWNYPFHNILNPLLAAVFSGNAIVIKVSEYASWSANYFGRIISAALLAAGAPLDLVQIVTGYGEVGNALVEGGVDKLIFVGSTSVGRKVMEAASKTLTPVVLELGGKDPFIVCDDADIEQALAVGLRGVFQSCGQNCTNAERFIVHTKVYDRFCNGAAEVVKRIRVSSPLHSKYSVDCGAICMPNHIAYLQELLDDAVDHGAKVIAQAALPSSHTGQYFPPTVLINLKPWMRIMQEETFGPIMCIIEFRTDDEAVNIANDCEFGLGSNVWSNEVGRARKIAYKLKVGMSSINDFCVTYMSQSLPFGGVKSSGFDRFAGIEGLRGLCVLKSVAEDKYPKLIKTGLPPLLRYPVSSQAFLFVQAIVHLFYSPNIFKRARAAAQLIAINLKTKSKSY
mmetsp:Transcript_10197/g.62172  ORF Transcript_10197/g.62172 Transcript_10197/m.62172 type:complete len:600 (-) Transcript_10197:4380-6179(-)|eukprot:CAMPEP_0183825664 /NCGR_PEP_ID=MMETSP0807_2-20130328/1264_1 /TAXON_ID=88271 /ORGANISM="Picocystis salinarum, Strain CCMP1897" /LENGTH=599 /DNA_ID=CAMNT_0026070693 /DNA_START=95 /DNA_END=1894 /DNA_ORIENTATION=-